MRADPNTVAYALILFGLALLVWFVLIITKRK